MEDTTNLISEEKDSIQYSIIVDDGRDELGNYNPIQHMPSSDNKTSSLLESFQSGVSDAFTSLCKKMLDKIVDYIEQPSFLDNLKNILNEALQPLRDSTSDLQPSERFAERKAELLEVYSKWGSFGWTPAPFMPVGYFNVCPPTILEADKKMLAIISDDTMNSIFDFFIKECNFRKSDLTKAISFYNCREYKACAYYLFSIIDALLITSQKKIRKKKNRKDDRKVGVSAVRLLHEKTEVIIDDPHKLFLPLDFTSLFACLTNMFGYTHDFDYNQSIINRNSLCHGMYTHKVRKKDCIKLFLVLYNLFDCIDYLSKSGKADR